MKLQTFNSILNLSLFSTFLSMGIEVKLHFTRSNFVSSSHFDLSYISFAPKSIFCIYYIRIELTTLRSFKSYSLCGGVTKTRHSGCLLKRVCLFASCMNRSGRGVYSECVGSDRCLALYSGLCPMSRSHSPTLLSKPGEWLEWRLQI